jgi:N-methylhydantoinase B
LEIGTKGDLEFACNAIFDRVAHPPKGRDGGLAGVGGTVALKSGATLRTKGFQIIPDDDRLLLHLPGGGGMGDPHLRPVEFVARDVRDGLVSAAAAAALYGVVVLPEGGVDAAATARLRQQQ